MMTLWGFPYLVCVVFLLVDLNKDICRVSADDASKTCDNPDCDSIRVINEEELKMKDGEGADGEIWLSIFGEVYDVTKGEKFYGPGAGYSYFAGRDASPCFTTGKFNEEGSKQSLDDLKASQLESIDSWRVFYAEQEKYPFLGVLHGTFYNSEGKPTPMLRDVRLRIMTMSQKPRPTR